MKIKNMLHQPVSLHQANGEGLHLGAREMREILAESITEDIKLAAERGVVVLIEDAVPLVEEPVTEAVSETPTESVQSEPVASEEPAADQTVVEEPATAIEVPAADEAVMALAAEPLTTTRKAARR